MLPSSHPVFRGGGVVQESSRLSWCLDLCQAHDFKRLEEQQDPLRGKQSERLRPRKVLEESFLLGCCVRSLHGLLTVAGRRPHRGAVRPGRQWDPPDRGKVVRTLHPDRPSGRTWSAAVHQLGLHRNGLAPEVPSGTNVFKLHAPVDVLCTCLD